MRSLLFLAFLLSAGCCFGQPAATRTLALYQVTEQNGLSDDHINCVLKDHQGFVWIGTSDGLNVMDGSQVTVFKHRDNDRASLGNNDIRCLAEDAAGMLWMGTDFGLDVYNPAQRSFEQYAPAEHDYGASNIIKSIVVDRQQRIWCATDGGLFLFDQQQKTFHPFFITSEPGNRYVNRLTSLMLDRRGQLWVCSGDGLWTFDLQRRQFKKEISAANDARYDPLILSVLEDHNGTIWAGSWEKGLKELDPHTGKVNSYSFVQDHKVSDIKEVKQADGRYVFWLNGELLTFDPALKQFFQYPIPFELSAYPTVFPCFLSADNWIWLGSDKGLFILNPQRQLFHHRFPGPGTSQQACFIETGQALLVGAQSADFLKAYNSNWQLQKDYSSLLQAFPPAAGQRHTAALAFEKENDSSIWVGTSWGLLQLDLTRGKSHWYGHQEADSNSLPRNFIAHLFLDSHRRLWVFPWREGVWQMDSAGGRFHKLWNGFTMDAGKIKSLVVADATEDSAGNIWMADLDEGIILYDRAKGTFSKPFAAQTGPRVFAGRIFYRNGYCYSAMERALVKWKPGTESLQRFPLPSEMSKDVADMVPDKAGRWWMATRNGLVVFDEAAGIFQRFTVADGLASNDMNGTLFCRENGTILFASPAYITSFDPEELLQTVRKAPTAVMRDIMVNGRELVWDSSRPLQLDHRSTDLLFHWTITDYSNPFNNRFYCMLEGIDSGWRYVGNKGEIQYANLSPGKYRLLLKGVTANGIASGNNLPVVFVIHPPFWKTWWFLLLLLLLLGGIIYVIFRLRIHAIRKEESVKSAFNKQKAELEMKALRAQMNPHFVFNSLSSIQESIVTGKTEAASKYLSKFSRLIRLILENSGKKFIPLKTEIESLTLYLELESFRFENFTYIISIDPAVDADSTQIPSMVIQPFAENALKHGFSHQAGNKQLTISIREEAGQLVAIVEDNGIGRKQAAAAKARHPADHHSMGMRITGDRLQFLRLQDSEKPAIFITDLEDENGKAMGTRVKIILPTGD